MPGPQSCKQGSSQVMEYFDDAGMILDMVGCVIMVVRVHFP